MAFVTPQVARDLMVRNLRLALHGPEGDELEIWPGFDGEPRVVTQGQEFPGDVRLNKPMHDGLGNEVLARPPAFLYGVGILYPRMTTQQSAELSLKQQALEESDIDEAPDDVQLAPQGDLPEPSAGDADAEAPIPAEEPIGRPRSLALSIHIPPETLTVEVVVSGATYEPLKVSVAGREKTLWRRSPLRIELSLSTQNNVEQLLEAQGLSFRVGLSVQEGVGSEKICTVFVVNETATSDEVSQSCLFQSKLSIYSGALLPYPRGRFDRDSSEESFSLLYRHHPVMSVGHGSDSRAEHLEGGWLVSTDVMPAVTVQSPDPEISRPDGSGYKLGMLDLATSNEEALGSIEHLLDDYGVWITSKEAEVHQLTEPRHQTAAARHIESAKQFLADMRSGWQIVTSEPEVGQIFRWVCLAMNAQRVAAKAELRVPTEAGSALDSPGYSVGSPHGLPDFNPNSESFGFGELDFENQAVWRPFQLAFLLASIAPLVDKENPSRGQVDIIWMPTGGGKTEAYLALAAFTMLWERRQELLRAEQPKYRVSVMMRYTLRLLTTQQVLRAAALVCALEIIRETNTALLDGPKRVHFRIGAWLGGSTTANSWADAIKDFTKLAEGRNAQRTFLLTKCPWCSAEMGVAKNGSLSGYLKKPLRQAGKIHISIHCPDAACPFSKADGKFTRLPVLEVDEDIYALPPSFLIGTIDKFAQIAWKPEARKLFGLKSDEEGGVRRFAAPPDLMIQDELHLIAGPLGSMNALYELALENLCIAKGGAKPRIIAATATTKNFDSQISRLYGRSETRLLPPYGIEIEDNFFSRSQGSDSGQLGKTYVAVCARGLGTVVESQLRVISAMAHGSAALDNIDSQQGDAWWTNLAFFSSRRSLGLQLAATQASLRIHTWSLTQRSGVRTGVLKSDGSRGSVRSVSNIRELTATSGENISNLMNSLSLPKQKKGSVDLCFATSMIEVGVDVPRLGLMTVMGQPKSASQYIQVTGRVGRDIRAPGLVVVVLSPYNVRDRSHFENFRQNHERLYGAVEAVSVTPYTAQSLGRAASGMVTTVLRATSNLPPMQALEQPEAHDLFASIRQRVAESGDQHAMKAVEIEIERLLEIARVAERQGNATWDAQGLLLRAGDTAPAAEGFDHWIVPMSMRSVDLECGVQVARRPGGTNRTVPLGLSTGHDNPEDEDLF